MFRLQTKIHRLICMQTPVYNQQLNKPSIPNVLCATDPIWVSEDWVSSHTNPLKTSGTLGTSLLLLDNFIMIICPVMFVF